MEEKQQQQTQENNIFTLKGQVLGDWQVSNNPEFDERDLMIRTIDTTGKYQNIIKVLVNGRLQEKGNFSFDVDYSGQDVEVKGYIFGRYYAQTKRQFQILKATFVGFPGTTNHFNEDVNVRISEQVNVEVEDDDLPF